MTFKSMECCICLRDTSELNDKNTPMGKFECYEEKELSSGELLTHLASTKHAICMDCYRQLLERNCDICPICRRKMIMNYETFRDYVKIKKLEAKQPPQKIKDDLKRHADEGNLDAQLFLAISYRDGSYGFPIDKELFWKYITLAIQGGSNDAQILLGSLYCVGKEEVGVYQNSQKALELLLPFAQKDPIASFHLGSLYMSGVGVQKDFQEARRLLSISVRGGNKRAISLLNHLG
jgi:TPR repeat protein